MAYDPMYLLYLKWAVKRVELGDGGPNELDFLSQRSCSCEVMKSDKYVEHAAERLKPVYISMMISIKILS